MPVAPASTATSVVLEDDARRERAKARFYVFCQTLGWGGFLALNAVFVVAFGDSSGDHRPRSIILSSIVMITALGLLITHYSRPLLARWGWKQLGWRALTPRLFGLAAVQSAVWSAIGFSYSLLLHAIAGTPWTSKYSPTLLFTISWVQGMFLLCGWLCVYFFYHLFDRYNRLQIEQLKLATHVKEAELRALKSQVNPHFIFNSLNSLRALIDENPTRARQAVTQLANLLRYSLQSAQSETVAFEDELRVVNDYLALEQVRHEERLRVRLDIEPDTLGLAVPPLLLQTLVENAVKYGISTRPEGGEIVIIARCEDGQLHLRVINPGELPAAGALTKGAGGAAAASTGLGLKNAAERLRMFFGDRARLQLRAESESLVVAEVFIPVQITRA
jgi:signal transduction histidine kinase